MARSRVWLVRREIVLRAGAVLMLPLLFLSFPIGSGSPSSAQTQGSSQQQEESEESSLPQAFKGVGSAAGLITFTKTAFEIDPAFPAVEATAGFPDISFGIGYLARPGIVVGAQIAAQGIRIPTEVVCSTPGGRPEEEFSAGEFTQASGQVRVGGGTVKVTCAKGPATTTTSHLYNLVFLTAPASQGAEPPGQIAVVAVGFVSIVSRSVLASDTLTVETISELKDVNIGADPASTRYVHFDSIRVEASAATNGAEGGALTATKVIYAGGRVGATERFENPESLFKEANTALVPLGLRIRSGEKTESKAANGTDAHATAMGLVVEAGSTTDQNAPAYGDRKVSIGLGAVSALSHLEPNPFEGLSEAPTGLDEPTPPGFADMGTVEAAPPPPEFAGPTATIQPVAGGKYQLALDWSAFKVRALPADQAAAAWGGIAFLAGAITLIRRRFFAG